MIPQEVQTVLRTLEQAGHEAYVVGGCVRDMQMGLPPHDWDVTTSALPEETMALFPHFAIPTGLQHGTVTVRSGGVSCEVTTFRTDGDYPDHRHPAAVTFTLPQTAGGSGPPRPDGERHGHGRGGSAARPLRRTGGYPPQSAAVRGRSGTPLPRGCLAHSADAAVFRHAGLCH